MSPYEMALAQGLGLTPGQASLLPITQVKNPGLDALASQVQTRDDMRFGAGADPELKASMGPGLLQHSYALGGTDPALGHPAALARASRSLSPAAPHPVSPVMSEPLGAPIAPPPPAMMAQSPAPPMLAPSQSPFAMLPPVRPAGGLRIDSPEQPDTLAPSSPSSPMQMTVRPSRPEMGRPENNTPYDVQAQDASRAEAVPFSPMPDGKPDMSGDLFGPDTKIDPGETWSGGGGGDFDFGGALAALPGLLSAGMAGGKSQGLLARPQSISAPTGPVPFDSRGFAGLLGRRTL